VRVKKSESEKKRWDAYFCTGFGVLGLSDRQDWVMDFYDGVHIGVSIISRANISLT